MNTTAPSAAEDLAFAPNTNPRLVARLAGFAYIALFALGLFANFFVREGLTVAGDAAATVSNIAESEGLFRAGLVSFLAIFVLDVGIAWALHILFRRVNADLSLLTAWFRLVYTVLLGVASVFFFLVLELVGRTEYLATFDVGQLDTQVLFYLDAFNFTWLIGLLCFGIHLALLGYLILKSGYINRILGWALIVAGAGYAVDTLAHAGLANYADYATLFLLIVAVPSVVAEFWMAIWLLRSGGKELAPAQ